MKAESVQPRFTSPDVYTPKHLAEKILTSRIALEGERKQVTVLFADLKGSMELLADRDPEEAQRLLDPVLERLMEAVHRYEGTVNQVMGDGIMALFGAPIAHEDHAIRACYAALRMQRRVNLYADEVQRTGGAPVHIRVGLNSGEVVVRSIGSDLHMDYTAVGQTTHLAARVEQIAKPGSVLITGETLKLAEGYVEANPLGAVPIKGIETAIDLYEVIGVGVARSRLQASAARGLTRFVGRDTELEQLREALERSRAGHGQLIAVVGEPGVGKSRLFWEFTHSHRTHGWRILESGSVSYGKATPYLPVIDLLRSYFRLQERDDQREIRERITGKLLTLDRALESTLPPVLALFDVPIDDAQWQRLDPPQRRQQTLEAVKRLLVRESQVQPMLLIFEDLHWIDSETQAFLDSLVESVPTACMLLLVNYRPEYGHGWGGKTYYSQLPLDPLAPESAEELLEALLGSDTGLAPLKRLLIARTEGNPFFLEESIRTLLETQIIVGERGAYRLAKALSTIQIPATVQAVLAARIDRLSPDAKRLLQSAAVVGKDVPFVLLEAIAEFADEDLRRKLAHLQAAELIYETRLFPDFEYTFKHALTHEVAYGSLLHERRRSIHARIVEAIEALYPDRLTEHVERLAHHAFRGEVWTKAVAYLRQAGAKAAARAAYREAVACFDQALVALQHLPESRETIEQAIDLHLDASSALLPAGALAKSFDHIREAEALAEALGDERRLGWVFVYLTNRAWLSGDSDRALDVGQRALAIATRLGDVRLRFHATQLLGHLHQTRGDYRRAAELLRWGVESAQGEWRHEWFGGGGLLSLSSTERLAWCLAELGECAEKIGAEVLRIIREVDNPHILVLAHRSLGFVYLRRGDVRQAIPPLERGVELCRVAKVRLPFDVTASHLGYAYSLSGRLDQGIRLMEEALADSGATGTGNHALLLAYLGEGHLLAGRPDDALAVARRALEVAHRQKERGNEAWVLRLLGEIAAQADPPDLTAAADHYGRALVRAEELGMRPLMAHCHFGLGKLHRRTGDHAKIQEHLMTAATMYREMNMGFYLAQAEAELGPPNRKPP